MAELFISTEEMAGLSRQMGLIHGAFWGRFVAEEDMGRVMAALAAVCFDRWQQSHVDAVVHVRTYLHACIHAYTAFAPPDWLTITNPRL